MVKSSGNRSGGNRGSKGGNRAGGSKGKGSAGWPSKTPESLLVAVERMRPLRRENND